MFLSFILWVLGGLFLAWTVKTELFSFLLTEHFIFSSSCMPEKRAGFDFKQCRRTLKFGIIATEF